MRIVVLLIAGSCLTVRLRAADLPDANDAANLPSSAFDAAHVAAALADTNAPAATPPSTNAPAAVAPAVPIVAPLNPSASSTSTNAPAAPSLAPAVPTVAPLGELDNPSLDATPDSAPPQPGDPIKRFDGHVSLTTADFTVPDGWELRWRSDQALSIGVIRRDNTVVAGTTGRTIGSLYLPQGGTYRLCVKGADAVPWDVAIYALEQKPPADDAFYAPTAGPAFKPIADDAAAVLEAAPPQPAPPVAAPLPTELTAQQRQAVVTIKGDRAQGAGFFMKKGSGVVLMTTQTLIADNPNWQIVSATGVPVQVTGIRVAADRDVAMLDIKNFGYPALPEGDPMQVQAGDSLLTTDEAGTPLPPVAVNSVELQRLDTAKLASDAGSPVVLASTGCVVGMTQAGVPVAPVADFADQSFSQRKSAMDESTKPGAERFDNVSSWETATAANLQVQGKFLDDFHEHSLNLDAYLNAAPGGHHHRHGSNAFWQGDDKIKSANDGFLQDIAGGDPAQRREALNTLLFQLGLVADQDMDQIQQPANFSGYQRQRAQDEIAYRQALKTELEQLGSDLSRFDDVVRANNPNAGG